MSGEMLFRIPAYRDEDSPTLVFLESREESSAFSRCNGGHCWKEYMADITFDCSLTCTSDAHLWVNDNEVSLDESGLTKTGQFTTPSGGAVSLRAQLEGVKGSAWSLEITPECQGTQPPKLWSRSGTFKSGGIVLSGTGQVPADPCAHDDGLDLAREVLPERLKSRSSRSAKKIAARKATGRIGKTSAKKRTNKLKN